MPFEWNHIHSLLRLYFYNNFLLLLIVNVDEVGFICNTKIHSFPFILFFSFPICYDSFVISETKKISLHGLLLRAQSIQVYALRKN